VGRVSKETPVAPDGQPTGATIGWPSSSTVRLRPLILVVDDSPDERFATSRAFTRAGFDVEEAATGEAALMEAARRPDLVVLDVNLPDLSGFEVCRRLKTDAETKTLPVLHLSGTQIDAASYVHGLEGGADAYLTHPVEPGVLVATARALLRTHAAEDKLRRALAQSELLERVTARFADARTPEQVVGALVERSRCDLSTRDATMYQIDQPAGVLRLLQTTSREVALERYAEVELDAAMPASEVARTGIPLYGASAQALGARYPHLEREYRGVGGGAWAAVPLVAYGQRLGVLVLSFLFDGELSPDERDLLVALGERCGQALERALLHDQQRQVAIALQVGLLPAAMPDVAELEFGTRYVSGTRGMSVGGDFYDVFARDDDWIAIVGDVCGRGAEAASLTGMARHTVRAEAPHRHGPSDLLTGLNQATIREDTNPYRRFLTAACVVLRPEAGGVTLIVSTGGHPPPLVARRHGATGQLPIGGPLIGVLDDVAFPETRLHLRRGDTLLLFTDGVTEARDGTDQWGPGRLGALLGAQAAAGATAQATADAVVEAAQAHASSVDDDMAVLSIRVR
jgi:serine phosphatase RsbU (regulator of sigma subunit)/DNA-binding response OmpR family regulator